MRHLLPSFCLILFCSACLAQPIVFTEGQQSVSVVEHSSVLVESPGQTVTIDSLLKNPNRYRFVPTQQALTNEPSTRASWFRFEAQPSAQNQLFLASDLALPTSVTLYLVDGDQLISRHTLGPKPDDGIWVSSQPRRDRIIPLHLEPSRRYTFYWHAASIPRSVKLVTGVQLASFFQANDLFWGLYYGILLLIILYNLLLFIQLRDFDHLTYAFWVGLLGVNYGAVYGCFREWLPGYYLFFEKYNLVISNLAGASHIMFAILFLQIKRRSLALFRWGLAIIGVLLVGTLLDILFLFHNNQSLLLFSFTNAVLDLGFSILAAMLAIRQGFKPAWYFLVGILLIWVGVAFVFSPLPYTFWKFNSVTIASMAEIIVFTLALSYKVNLLKKQREDAIREQLALAEKNQRLIERQNATLEQMVEERTRELRASQVLLVQKEKLASLGELTAGIAHEIQNPLNFVNNFSEVSTELVEELKEEAQAGRTDDVLAIAGDLTHNLTMITHHGKRADAIVRSMLEHSRVGGGERQPTDLNQLAEEYLRLAYQGKRAKDATFDCKLETSLAADLPLVSVVPQDLGRVLLNLYNNALYAVQQKSLTSDAAYAPTVWVSTRLSQGLVTIEVRDNGTGIPEGVQAKIFQPFFTTKPTGEGTGLGLSLSYDIITKAHGGQLLVESLEGFGTTFLIQLPYRPESTGNGTMNNALEYLAD